jgi:hypothetical protein
MAGPAGATAWYAAGKHAAGSRDLALAALRSGRIFHLVLLFQM